MFAHLGKVLYWLASGVAGLMLALCIYLLMNGQINIATGAGLIAARRDSKIPQMGYANRMQIRQPNNYSL